MLSHLEISLHESTDNFFTYTLKKKKNHDEKIPLPIYYLCGQNIAKKKKKLKLCTCHFTTSVYKEKCGKRDVVV